MPNDGVVDGVGVTVAVVVSVAVALPVRESRDELDALDVALALPSSDAVHVSVGDCVCVPSSDSRSLCASVRERDGVKVFDRVEDGLGSTVADAHDAVAERVSTDALAAALGVALGEPLSDSLARALREVDGELVAVAVSADNADAVGVACEPVAVRERVNDAVAIADGNCESVKMGDGEMSGTAVTVTDTDAETDAAGVHVRVRVGAPLAVMDTLSDADPEALGVADSAAEVLDEPDDAKLAEPAPLIRAVADVFADGDGLADARVLGDPKKVADAESDAREMVADTVPVASGVKDAVAESDAVELPVVVGDTVSDAVPVAADDAEPVGVKVSPPVLRAV